MSAGAGGRGTVGSWHCRLCRDVACEGDEESGTSKGNKTHQPTGPGMDAFMNRKEVWGGRSLTSTGVRHVSHYYRVIIIVRIIHCISRRQGRGQ